MSVVIEITRDGWTNQLQLAIVDGTGVGYRLAGPKFNGSSETLLCHELTARDAAEIRCYLNAAFPVNP